MQAHFFDDATRDGHAPAGMWAVREARRRQLEFVRASSKAFVPVIVVGAIVSVGVLKLFGHPAVIYAVGASDMALVAGLYMLIVQYSGAANALVGADAEQWTAQELRPLRRAGWRVLHGVPIDARRGNIDHVVIAPSCVFALETKWSRTWSLRQGYSSRVIASAAQQARDAATRVRGVTRSLGVEVKPLVVLWGTCDLPADHVHDTVPVVRGLHLRRWLEAEAARLDRDNTGRAHLDQERTLDVVATYAAARHRDEMLREPVGRFVQTGISGVLGDVLVGLTAGMGGLYAVLLVLARAPWPLSLAVASALGGAGWLTRRRGARLRAAGIGWSTGSVAAVAIFLALAAILAFA